MAIPAAPVKDAAPTIAGLLIGTAGAVGFFLLGAPLPWMLGAMVTTALAAMLGQPIVMPRWLRNTFVPILGVMFGSVFDFSGLVDPAGFVALVAVLAASIAITTGLGYGYFRWFGLDPVTSCFAAVPGSLSEIIVLADRLSADVRAIALVHSARLVIAVSAISFLLRYLLDIDLNGAVSRQGAGVLGFEDVVLLAVCAAAGYGAAVLIRLPAPQMFGPLILSALAHAAELTDSQPPGWSLSTAQILLGVFIGTRFSGVRFREASWLLAISSGWAVLLLPIAVALAYVAAATFGFSFETALLGLAPGGVAEVSMLAVAAGISLTFITTAQLVRISLIVIGASLVGKLLKLPRDPS